ncbi:ATP-binding SpoIIE family protein phosphatase [Catenulispora subtropica]
MSKLPGLDGPRRLGAEHLEQLAGIDTERSVESVQDFAEALQRTLLPSAPPHLDGAHIAFRYLPSNDVTAVGGDWFDAMALPGKRIALVVGDVMGHGVASAAIMGQLRTAVQTLAHLGLPPDEVLWELDECARRLSDTHLATCLYGIYDRVTQVFSVANAGHIPPILAVPGQRAALADIPCGTPIGVGGHGFETAHLQIPDGTTLVLCTDGLVETRTREVGEGLDALCALVTGLRSPLEQACDAVVQMLATVPRGDDAALVMASFAGIADDQVASWSLEPVPRAAGQARRLVRRRLADWKAGHLSETAEALIGELVANTCGYASRPVTVRLIRTETLTCEVYDDAHKLPARKYPDVLSESGRGLGVVAALADRWGYSRTEDGKVVWFELDGAAPDDGHGDGGHDGDRGTSPPADTSEESGQ